MLYKTPLFLFLAVCCQLTTFAQAKDTLGTAVYAEFFGRGFLSTHVELPLSKKNKNRFSLGVSFMDYDLDKGDINDGNYPSFSTPSPSIMYLHLIGKHKKYFEIGVGMGMPNEYWDEEDEDATILSINTNFGFRYHLPNQFLFRAIFTSSYDLALVFRPSLAVSFGYSW